jgi:serine/threonine-protein kinase SRK2
LPRELKEPAQAIYYQRNVNLINFSPQRVEEIMKIVGEARTIPNLSRPVESLGSDKKDDDEEEYLDANDEEWYDDYA